MAWLRKPKVQMISLGAWCRTAHQVAHYATIGAIPAQAHSGPFDWTVTPFAALKTCLAPDFDPAVVLRPGEGAVSPFGSALCRASGVIFHHAIDTPTMKRLGYTTPGAPVPATDEAFNALAEAARGRFVHTFRNLTALRETTAPILLVRWQRFGHPDFQLPSAFTDEADATMLDLVDGFLGHDRSRLLTVVSRVTPERRDPFPDPVRVTGRTVRTVTCQVEERQGHNGDQTRSFRGDEHGWSRAIHTALEQVVA